MSPGATAYTPHTAATQKHYDALVSVVRRHLPFGIDDSVAEIADDVISVCRNSALRETEKQLRLEEVLGKVLSLEHVVQLLQLCAELNDFVSAENTGAQAAAPSGADQDANALGALYEVEDEGDNDDVNGDADATSSRAARLRRLASLADDDDADDSIADGGRPTHPVDDGAARGESTLITPDQITSESYLKTDLRKLFPDLTTEEVTVRADRVLQYLSEDANGPAAVTGQLMMLLGGWSDDAVEDWISRIVASRWAVVYGLRLAELQRRCLADENQDPSSFAQGRDAIVELAASHAQRNPEVAPVVAALRGETGAAARRLAASSYATATDVTSHRPLQLLDLEAYTFVEGARLMAKEGKTIVPQGTQRVTYDTFEEIVLPAQVPTPGKVPLVTVDANHFPPWAVGAFPAYVKALNPMQSVVFPGAFQSDHNLLVCAPTGAGKTNVALLCVLRELTKYRDEANHGFFTDAFKIVYVAPMKALVQEMVRTFTERLTDGGLGISVCELSGDNSVSQAQLASIQVIVTTPEKWDIVTRKAVDVGTASVVRLLIIDEVHLLHSERGAVLEAIVARTHQQAERTGEPIRIVGLSATLPNYKDVATFLRAPTQGVYFFDATFRPVPLRQTYCAPLKRTQRAASAAVMLNDIAYQKVLQQAGRAQSLVFVHGRQDTINTARFLRDKAMREGKIAQFISDGSSAQAALTAAASTVPSKWLRDLLPFGFGCHHAGMSREERSLVETLFADRHLQVLVSTSTLAWGVNLPAHAVIIKGTKVFAPEKGRMVDLSPLDVLQMFGRAGRPGFDDFGEAVIITGAVSDLDYYLSLLNEQLPIESHLVARLVDSLNAEVCLGTVSNLEEAAAWLQHTYLFTRMCRSPRLYGLDKQALKLDPMLLSHRRNLAHSALAVLAQRHLVKYDADASSALVVRYGQAAAAEVKSTDLGRIASHFFITANSMATYHSHMHSRMEDFELFRVFSLSDEFSHISVRSAERAEIEKLAREAPIAIQDAYDSPPAKINVLLQAFIGRVPLEGYALASEMVYVKDSALRIAKAIHEISLCRGWAQVARKALDLYQQVLRQQWTAQCPLRQLPSTSFSPEALRLVERQRLPWSAYYYLDVENDYAAFSSDSHMQDVIHQGVHRIPRMDFDFVAMQPVSHDTIRLEFRLIPDFEYVAEVHGTAPMSWLLTVEDTEGEKLLYRRPFECTAAALESQAATHFACVVRVPHLPCRPTHYFARVAAIAWIGTETSHAVSLHTLGMIGEPTAVAPSALVASPASAAVSMDVFRDSAMCDALFPAFAQFNAIQSAVVPLLWGGQSSANGSSVMISAPLGYGRNACIDIFLAQYLRQRHDDEVAAASSSRAQAMYITPFPDQAARFYDSLRGKLQRWEQLAAEDGRQAACHGVNVVLLGAAGNAICDLRLAAANDIIIASVDAVKQLIRRARPASFANITHLAADHLHTLGGNSRWGPTYEYVLATLVKDRPTPARPLRLLALGHCMDNCMDVGEWLGVPKAAIFHYTPSHRIASYRVEQLAPTGFASRTAHAAMSVMTALATRPKYRSARVLVFMPTVALALEQATLLYELYRDPVPAIPGFDDEKVGRLAAVGVAVLHRGLSARDLRHVIRLLMDPDGDGAPLTCFATAEDVHLAAGCNMDFVFVCGTHRQVVSNGGVVTDIATEPHLVLQMMARGAVESVVLVLPNERDWWTRLLSEPIPVWAVVNYTSEAVLTPRLTATSVSSAMSASTVEALVDLANGWVAAGRVASMAQLVQIMATHLLLGRSLRRFPSAYGIATATTSANAAELRSDWLSGVAEAVVEQLSTTLHCVVYDAASFSLRPAVFCTLLARGDLPASAVAATCSVREEATLPELIQLVAGLVVDRASTAAGTPITPIEVSSFKEVQALRRVASKLSSQGRYVKPLAAAQTSHEWLQDVYSKQTKATLLLTSHLCRIDFSASTVVPWLASQVAFVVHEAARVASALVDVVGKLSWPVTLRLVKLRQLLVQASWDTDSVLLQLPYFDAARAQVASENGVHTIDDLANCTDDQRDRILGGLAPANVGAVAEGCNSMPIVDCAATVSVSTLVDSTVPGVDVQEEADEPVFMLDRLEAAVIMTIRTTVPGDDDDDGVAQVARPLPSSSLLVPAPWAPNPFVKTGGSEAAVVPLSNRASSWWIAVCVASESSTSPPHQLVHLRSSVLLLRDIERIQLKIDSATVSALLADEFGETDAVLAAAHDLGVTPFRVVADAITRRASCVVASDTYRLVQRCKLTAQSNDVLPEPAAL